MQIPDRCQHPAIFENGSQFLERTFWEIQPIQRRYCHQQDRAIPRRHGNDSYCAVVRNFAPVATFRFGPEGKKPAYRANSFDVICLGDGIAV